MGALLAPDPMFRAYDNNNNPLAGGQLYTYQAGTTTPAATYTDSTAGTPNPNPVVLNARGEAPVWLSPTQAYKLVLKDANGNTIWTVDQVTSPAPVAVGNMTDEKGSNGQPGFSAANGDFTPGTTTSLTLSTNYGSASNLWVAFDAAEQGADTYSLSGTTLTFNAPIPNGTNKVYVKGGTALTIGLPSIGSVTDASVASGSRLYNRITDIFDVRDYGAKGNWNGSVGNDDTSAIQAAISAMTSGGLLFFPPGNYKVSGAINLASNICYYGPGATITQTANNTQIFKGTALNNVWFDSLSFQGVGYNDTAPTDDASLFFTGVASAIYITSSSGIGVTRCKINQFLNGGLLFAYNSNMYISQNTIVGTFQGAGDSKTPPGNGSFAAFGIYIYAGNSNLSQGIGNIHVVDNTINTTCHGIFVGPGYTNVRICGNQIYNLAQHGCYLNPGSKLIVTENQISLTYGDGIKVQSGNVAMFANPDGIVVSNNTITNSPNGIWGIIVDCITSTGDTTSTIFSNGVSVVGNQLYAFGTGGIYVGHARGVIVSENVVQNAAGVGIQAVSFEGSIENNRVESVFGNGISASPEIYSTVNISGNTVNGSNLSPGGGSDISVSPSSVYAWTGSTFFATGNYATNGGNLYQVTAPGTSAASGGPSGAGGSISDGAVTWKYISAAGSIDYGTALVDRNYVLANSADLAVNVLFVAAGGIHLGWRHNNFAIVLPVDISNSTMLDEDGNIFPGGYAVKPMPAGPLPGHFGRQYSGSAAPVSGTWFQGDVVWAVAPLAGNNIGWVCTTGGTPGTWKTFGSISA